MGTMRTIDALPTWDDQTGPCADASLESRVRMRIPVKWSGDSGEVVRCRSEATLAGFRMIQVDHIRQVTGPRDIH